MNIGAKMVERLRDEAGFGLVETMVALTILVIGLLAVSGMTLASASQARVADLRSDQAMAAQRAIELVRQDGFAAADTRTDTLEAGGREFYATTTVAKLNRNTKTLTVVVTPAAGGFAARTYRSVLHSPRALPPEFNPFDP